MDRKGHVTPNRSILESATKGWSTSRFIDESFGPDKRYFTAVPKFARLISPNIRQLSWNAINRTLSISIEENDKFDAFTWLERMNERAEYVSNLADDVRAIEEETLTVTFNRANDTQVARMCFCDLTLVDHECSLDVDEEPDTGHHPVIHKVKVGYTKCLRLAVAESAEIEADNLRLESDPDGEWRESRKSF